MVQSQFSLSWESYKTSICNGFSTLQQNGEFVDMTIAADGHFVKVHQILIALASPYLKDLVTSAPCQHPVIFLNNVSHRTLCLLLEYIYTGEVAVPADCLMSFSETAKSLHIRGLENISHPTQLQVATSGNMPQFDESEICHVSGLRTISAPDNSSQVNLPAAARKIIIKQDQNSSLHDDDNVHDYSDFLDDTGTQDSDEDYKMGEPTPKKKKTSMTPVAKENQPTSNLQYTISIRGSLQMILNRFIYNLQSSTAKSGIRRWRCVDYRGNKCTAFVVTKGNVVINRANLHNHPFHDKKILLKIEKKAVYSAIDEVIGYKDNEGQAIDSEVIENDNFLTLPDFTGGDKNNEMHDIKTAIHCVYPRRFTIDIEPVHVLHVFQRAARRAKALALCQL